MKKLLVLVLSLALLLTLAACTPDFWRESTSAKPVIYLYPEEKQDETCDAKPVAYLYPQTETEITVRLDYDGELTFDETVSAKFPQGAYRYDILYTHGDKTTLARGNCAAAE